MITTHNRHNIVGRILFPAIMLLIIFMAASCKKIDKQYINAKPTAGNFSGNTMEYLQSQPGLYDSLLFILNRVPRLKDSISKNEVTVFAISNRSLSLALQNINQARHDSIPRMGSISLASIDSAVLDTFLCRYILQQKIVSADIKDLADGLFFPTINYVNRNDRDTSYNMQLQFTRTSASGFVGGGPAAIIFSDPKGSIFQRYWVRVNTITVDIKTNNSIVHLLPPGHDFGFGDEFIRAVNFR